LEVPVTAAGFGASPIIIEEVTPLKTGNGLLRLTFVQAIHPIAARKRETVIRVLSRTDNYLIGTIKDKDGNQQAAMLTLPEYEWLETYCPLLIKRRGPSNLSFLMEGEPLSPKFTAEEYLNITFGRTPIEALRVSSADSFGERHAPMPARHSIFRLGQEYNSFDSWMIARGFIPSCMEDKWFIYMDDDRLFFRRSWTGNLIYEVEAIWRDDRIFLGNVCVNRETEQYQETDDDYDCQLLNFLISEILLGEYASFPIKDDIA